MPNLLTTPSAIRDAIWNIFPLASFQGKVTDNGFCLECRLSTTSKCFQIDRVINNLKLVPELKSLFCEIMASKKLGYKVDKLGLNVERLSLMPPLREWKKFQRNSFLEKGHTIEAVLIDYLSGVDLDEKAEILFQLNLSPGQLQDDFDEAELVIFRSVCSRLKSMSETRSADIFAKLEEKYPRIFQVILSEMKSESLSSKNSSVYDDTLLRIKSRVIGQSQAAELLASTLASQKKSESNSVFMFVGPTGVGKTEAAKVVATIKDNRFVMISMNQYLTEWSSNNLFGSQIGFVGSDSPPHFAELMKKFRTYAGLDGYHKVYEVNNVVLLFDELEKAHNKVKESLLTLLDEGYCEVQHIQRGDPSRNISERYVFRKCIFIATSNLFQREILQGFSDEKNASEIANEFVLLNSTVPIQNRYSPEFLGRFSKIIPFGPIPKGDEYQKLVRLKMTAQLANLKTEFGCLDFIVEDIGAVLRIVEHQLYREGTDIRRLNSYFYDDLKRLIYSKGFGRLDLSDKVFIIAPYSENLIGIKVAVKLFGRTSIIKDLIPIPV